MSELEYVVVVIGAATPVGRELRAVLDERGFPVREWRLFDVSGDDGDDDELSEALLGLDAIDVDGADVVFLCGPPTLSLVWAPRASDAGAVTVDLTHAMNDDDVGLVVPEVNASVVSEHLARGLFVCPVPGATAMAVVLKALEEAAELKRVVVTAFEPASHVGGVGVEELAQQTRALLVGESVEPDVFPHRIAFNVIPQIGEFVSGGRTRGEWLIESQTRTLLGHPDLPIAVTGVYVPTFFGQAYAIHVETEQPLDAAAARVLLREAPGILLHEASGGGAEYPTLAEVIGSEATHVGRVRDDPTVPYGLALWAAIDGLRKGVAVNAVEIAERALRERA